ncbi:hypothetical protein N7468_006047 [Penicillium chermesinum]|uniref:Uncharacterized protein n=1 Tax=Penicillium chermesinum TaxID=63820 RepID=A0A9W9TNI7_9EURO|nr:uncharacterized protein N7468_006047 [Penicillium chermesinum]KAJ5233091.1 hypothetical protein N7468_006047 [Penicillium chermesinum]
MINYCYARYVGLRYFDYRLVPVTREHQAYELSGLEAEPWSPGALEWSDDRAGSWAIWKMKVVQVGTGAAFPGLLESICPPPMLPHDSSAGECSGIVTMCQGLCEQRDSTRATRLTLSGGKVELHFPFRAGFPIGISRFSPYD